MQHFRIERTGALDLEFEGTVLTDLSSQEDNIPRWTEIRIYKTSRGSYVTEMVGATTVSGERERRDVKIVNSPAELADALKRQPRGYLTKLALEALDEAAENDPDIRPAVTERI
jgi:hypothetical protein